MYSGFLNLCQVDRIIDFRMLLFSRDISAHAFLIVEKKVLCKMVYYIAEKIQWVFLFSVYVITPKVMKRAF